MKHLFTIQKIVIDIYTIKYKKSTNIIGSKFASFLVF